MVQEEFSMRVLIATVCLMTAFLCQPPALAQEAEDDQKTQTIHDGFIVSLSEPKCDAGDAKACVLAGTLMLRSGGDERADEALEILKKGCELGDPDGCYRAGVIVNTDENRTHASASIAEALYAKGCALDHGPSCFNQSASIYARWSDASGEEVFLHGELVIKACEKGYERACPLARELQKPSAISVEELAENGDAGSQFDLGFALFLGNEAKGVVADPVKAAHWLEKAAAQNHTLAQGLLGHMYRFGVGVDVDLSKATDLLRSAAVAGNVISQYDVGSVLLYRDNPQYTLYEATKWLMQVAERDGSEHPDLVGLAIVDLVLLSYENSPALSYNSDEVTRLLRRAVALGNEEAQQELDYHCEDHPDTCS